LFGVQCTLRAGQALTDYFGIFVDEDCHFGVLLFGMRDVTHQ
jgi:hypothetical protein